VVAETTEGSTSWDVASGDELVSRCRVQSRLGGGNAYEAYACFDDRLLASVVVKIVRPNLVDDPPTLRMLAREARVLGALNHPVIVRGLHARVDGPRPYLAMERVPGPRLSTLLRRFGPLSPDQVLPLGMQIASALHYLHENEFVHLDVKPSNIIMDTVPRLIDFSIARSIDQAAELEHVVGTDRYLSPEQAQPQGPDKVGPASDIWGLGATLFEAITGGRPVDTNDQGPERTHAIPDRVPGAPDELEAIVLRCLQFEPSARPTPVEVFDTLDPLAARLPKPRLTHLR